MDHEIASQSVPSQVEAAARRQPCFTRTLHAQRAQRNPQNSIISKSAFFAEQSGQPKLSGTSAQRVPGGMPSSG